MAARKKGEPPNRSKAAKKRSYASRTPYARSLKKPGKVKESGSAGYAVARLAQAAGKSVGKKSLAKSPSQIKRELSQDIKKFVETDPAKRQATARSRGRADAERKGYVSPKKKTSSSSKKKSSPPRAKKPPRSEDYVTRSMRAKQRNRSKSSRREL